MAETMIYGLVGKNISYSFSRAYFTEKFQKEGISDSKYVNFDLNSLENFNFLVQNTENLAGMNVTIPYKEEIIPFLDELDEFSAQIGAVNTIKILENGKLKGFNTDFIGFWQSLQPFLKENHQKALILGTGGAAKAIAFALQRNRILFNFVSRGKQTAFSYSDLTKEIMTEHQIVINCTPLGTSPNVDECPEIPYNFITNQHLLFDLIYNPAKTRFLQQGEKQGATIINGYQMLVFQAEAAWKIWQTEEISD